MADHKRKRQRVDNEDSSLQIFLKNKAKLPAPIIVFFDAYENDLLTDKVKIFQELRAQGFKKIIIYDEYIDYTFVGEDGKEVKKVIYFLPSCYYKLPAEPPFTIANGTTKERAARGEEYFREMGRMFEINKGTDNETTLWDLKLRYYKLEKRNDTNIHNNRYYFERIQPYSHMEYTLGMKENGGYYAEHGCYSYCLRPPSKLGKKERESLLGQKVTLDELHEKGWKVTEGSF